MAWVSLSFCSNSARSNVGAAGTASGVAWAIAVCFDGCIAGAAGAAGLAELAAMRGLAFGGTNAGGVFLGGIGGACTACSTGTAACGEGDGDGDGNGVAAAPSCGALAEGAGFT